MPFRPPPRRTLLAIAIASTVVPRGVAHAQQPGGGVQGGDAVPEEVRVRGSQASGFSSRAREADAVREVTDAASLVEPLPGVHVRRLGADDGFATLSIRGSSSTQVAVLLAGVPLTGGADPTLDLATLPLWPGSQARVYRSLAPAALGPGSLGGTLVLDAPRPHAPPSFEAWSAVGSFGARRLRLGGVIDAGGGARIATALSASRSEDDFAYFDPLASGAAGHDVYASRVNAGHAAVNGLLAWSLPFHTDAGEGALTVTTLVQARRQHLPGPVLRPSPNQTLDSNREIGAVELSMRAGPGTWTARAWGRRDGLRVQDVATPGAALFGPTQTDDAIVATGGSLGGRAALGERWTLDARADASGERFAPGAREGAAPVPGATRVNVGGGLDAEWRPIEPLTLGASGRFDAWKDAGDDGDRKTELRPTGHVGAEIALGPVTLAAHGGAVARAPSFVERFGDRGAFLGDPALRPESAWVADAGGRIGKRLGVLRLEIEVVGFGTWAEDLIVFVPVGAFGYAKATNIGQARLAGVEAELRASLGPLALRTSYTGLSTANEATGACVVQTGPCIRPPLPGRPEHDFVGDLTYQLGPVRLRYGVDALTGITADLGGTVGVPPRVLQSAGVRSEVPGVRGLTLALDVRNLFDVRTAQYDGPASLGPLGRAREPIGDVFDYPLPGRSFLVSARLRLQ